MISVDVSVTYTITVTDDNDNLVYTHSDVCRSFTANFLRLLAAGMNNTETTVTDINGTTRMVKGFSARADTPNITTHGVVIGSGQTSVSLSDYQLAKPIASADVIYQPMNPNTPTITATPENISSVIAKRIFTNIGPPIQLGEMGLVVSCPNPVTATEPIYVLIIRDSFETPYIIDSYQKAEITYHMVTTI